MSVRQRRKQHQPIQLTEENQVIKAILTDDDMVELRPYFAALHPDITMVLLEALGNELNEVRLESKKPSTDIPTAIDRWNKAIGSTPAWVVMQIRIAYDQYCIDNSDCPDSVSLTQSAATYLRSASTETYAMFDFDVSAETCGDLVRHDDGDSRLKQFTKDLLTVNEVSIVPSNSTNESITFGP
jgi:hypothetical protein